MNSSENTLGCKEDFGGKRMKKKKRRLNQLTRRVTRKQKRMMACQSLLLKSMTMMKKRKRYSLTRLPRMTPRTPSHTEETIINQSMMSSSLSLSLYQSQKMMSHNQSPNHTPDRALMIRNKKNSASIESGSNRMYSFQITYQSPALRSSTSL